MTNTIIAIITKPVTITASSTVGVTSGVVAFFGIINPWVGGLTLLIGLIVAIVGGYLKLKKDKADRELSELKLANWKKTHQAKKK